MPEKHMPPADAQRWHSADSGAPGAAAHALVGARDARFVSGPSAATIAA